MELENLQNRHLAFSCSFIFLGMEKGGYMEFNIFTSLM